MNRLRNFLPLGVALISLPFAARATPSLWITEVVPDTGEVEVTNIGAGTVTASTNLPLCHRLDYSVTVPSGTVFAPGESKLFSVVFSNPGDSDLWLYQNSDDFSDGANLIAGLKWGPMPDIGNTDLASNGGMWPGASAFVPAPAAGMALQLTGPNPFSPADWSEGGPDLGTYTPHPLVVTIEPDPAGESFTLDWSGGSPPYRVRWSGDLANWFNVGPVNGETSRSFDTNQFGDPVFFQVIPGVVLEPTADYRVTFTSTWSRSIFQSVPSGDHFSGMIGATHNDEVGFWAPGQLASPGIESMAETGSKTILGNEINAAIAAGSGDALVSGGGLRRNGSTASLDFTAARSHPLFTLVSMLAPSPDWFVGIHGVSLLAADDEWIDLLTFDLFPYDAGSDDGLDFDSANAESDPHVPIVLIAGSPPFAVEEGVPDPPRPVATFRIERLP